MKDHFRAGLAGLSFLALLLVSCGRTIPTVDLAPSPTTELDPAGVQVIATVTRAVGTPVAVSVATSRRGAISSALIYSGHVQPDHQVDVAPRIPGRIAQVKVNAGDQVKAGDVIATIGSSDVALAVVKSQVAYDTAVAHLRAMQAGPRPDSLVEAQAALTAAKAKLTTVKNGPRPEAVSQARSNLVVAQAKLNALKNGPRAEIVAQARDNVESARAKLKQFLAGPTPQQLRLAQIAVEQSKNTLHAAQTTRDGSCNPTSPAYVCNAAQTNVDIATNAITAAQLQLTVLTLPPTDTAIQQAKAEADAAEQQYALARNPTTPDDLAQAQAGVDAATQQYALARTPYTQEDLDQAQALVDVAAALLRVAETPYTADDFKAAQGAIDVAKADLDLSKEQLAESTVTAPFDGIVSRRLLDVGALTGSGAPIVTLLASAAGVTINVEESKLGFVRVGQEAKVTVPTYPDVSFPATVQSGPQTIDPTARTGEVRLQVVDKEHLLKPGMFAQTTLLAAKRDNALLVPQTAVDSENAQSIVYIVADNTVKVQPVTVGLSDDTSAEITTGLKEGQVVVVGQKPPLSNGQRVIPSSADASPSAATGSATAAVPPPTTPVPAILVPTAGVATVVPTPVVSIAASPPPTSTDAPTTPAPTTVPEVGTPASAIASPTRPAAPTGNTHTGVIQTSNQKPVFVRQDPSTSANAIASVPDGATVTIIGVVQGTAVNPGDTRWYHVSTGAIDGYVYAQYVQVGS